MNKRRLLLLGSISALGALSLMVFAWLSHSAVLLSPTQVVQRYMRAVYARDYAHAYSYISEADKKYKSLENYLQENGTFQGFTLELAQRLAAYIEWQGSDVDIEGERALVTVKFAVPEGNVEAVRAILFADPQRSKSWPQDLSETQRQDLLARLEQLNESDQLPIREGEQTFTLVKEWGRWHIFENWSEAVVVRLSGSVKHGLPWEFGASQEQIRAAPGASVQTSYRAKNLADRAVTAKACHIIEPQEYKEYLETIQCFCLIQETLAAGEEKEMPLVFRVRWDAPSTVKQFDVRYEFYPIERFPEHCESAESDESGKEGT